MLVHNKGREGIEIPLTKTEDHLVHEELRNKTLLKAAAAIGIIEIRGFPTESREADEFLITNPDERNKLKSILHGMNYRSEALTKWAYEPATVVACRSLLVVRKVSQ